MKSSTFGERRQGQTLADVISGRVSSWEELIQWCPALRVMESTARSSKALVRRRGVKSASGLLRMALAHSVCDWSLCMVSGWSGVAGVGEVSGTAVRNRLRGSVVWLGLLIGEILKARQLRLGGYEGTHVRIRDATTVSQPGSKGTDWRVHVSMDLGLGCVAGLEVTDAHGGETLARFRAQPGEIQVADGGYAFAKGMGAVLVAGGELVVRMSPHNLRVEDEAGQAVDVVDWLKGLGGQPGVHEREVRLSTMDGDFRLRLIAVALPQDKAEEARRRATESARKKGRTVSPRTLVSKGFVLVLTNLPAEAWPGEKVLELYGIRWQVEILFKRFKGVFALDHLRAHDPQLAQAYLLGKLLGVLLEEEMTHTVTTFHCNWLTDPDRPLRIWPLSKLCWQILTNLIQGPLTLVSVLQTRPAWRRFLCDAPRKRRPQRVQAFALLHPVPACQGIANVNA
jgi:hypothetical protein